MIRHWTRYLPNAPADILAHAQEVERLLNSKPVSGANYQRYDEEEKALMARAHTRYSYIEVCEAITRCCEAKQTS